VTSLLWLVAAVAAGGAAYAVGWPAWRDYRARETRDLNAERYLAWRGRASRGASGSRREGMTQDERRRLFAAAILAAAAAICLVVFFTVS
jgi:hypothetical protein